jgi:hypothetical protein
MLLLLLLLLLLETKVFLFVSGISAITLRIFFQDIYMSTALEFAS